MQVASPTGIQHKADRRRARAVHFADTFTFRLPADVSIAIRASADDSGKSKSEWLRAVIIREVCAPAAGEGASVK